MPARSESSCATTVDSVAVKIPETKEEEESSTIVLFDMMVVVGGVKNDVSGVAPKKCELWLVLVVGSCWLAKNGTTRTEESWKHKGYLFDNE